MGKRGDEQDKNVLITVSRERYGRPSWKVKRWLVRKLR
jgi:hypothetical protein